MSFKAAIFDLDGVIVDTVPFHFKAWKKMFADYEVDFSLDDYKSKVDGIPRRDGARAILKNASDKELDEACQKKQEYYLELIEKDEFTVYTSSIDLIRGLKAHAIKIAVASSSKNCKRILEKLGITELADAIVDGHDFKKGKPDPEIFQRASKNLNCNYDECVVFEDAVLGVEAALNGGMLCVGVDRYGKPERLARANIVVGDLSEASFEILKELFKR